MEKREDVASILSQLDLHDIEETLSQPYHTAGPGRPPRSPFGIFKALMVKQLRNIPATGSSTGASGTTRPSERSAT